MASTCVNVLIAKWFPICEKGAVVNIEMAGNLIGVMLIYPLASFACTHKEILGGWPLLFYISGKNDYYLYNLLI
jgi:hypothetical protein